MATLLEIKQGVLRRLAWMDDKVGLLPIPLTSTTTAADKAGIRDTALARGTHGAGNYDGRHVEIVETVVGSPTLGSVAAVDTGGFDLTDLIAVSPDFDDEVQAGTNYLMYPKKLVPETLADEINNVLKATEVPCFFPLSLHICTSDDNDMETAPATTFDANKLNATLANETTIVKNGGGSLKVTASAVMGGTHFGAVGVNEGESLCAAVDCYVTSGDSATFNIYGASGASATTDEVKWMELVVPFTVPSGVEQILAWVFADANGNIIYVDDYHVWRNGVGVYALPSWITHPSQLIDVRAFPQGTGGPAADNDYRANERASTGLAWEPEREDLRANKPLHITVACTGARPYIIALRPFAELSALTDTTPCDEKYVVAKAAAQILKNRGDEGWWVHEREARKRARKMGYGGRQLRGEAPTVLV